MMKGTCRVLFFYIVINWFGSVLAAIAGRSFHISLSTPLPPNVGAQGGSPPAGEWYGLARLAVCHPSDSRSEVSIRTTETPPSGS